MLNKKGRENIKTGVSLSSKNVDDKRGLTPTPFKERLWGL